MIESLTILLRYVFDRDLFYEVIRDWQECHMTPGWNMLETQGEKVRHLVGYRTELANHIHFARLFQSQLIQVTIGIIKLPVNFCSPPIYGVRHLPGRHRMACTRSIGTTLIKTGVSIIHQQLFNKHIVLSCLFIKQMVVYSEAI